jgi:hypothetical protein
MEGAVGMDEREGMEGMGEREGMEGRVGESRLSSGKVYHCTYTRCEI